jgi:hypothetical protein
MIPFWPVAIRCIAGTLAHIATTLTWAFLYA